MTATPQIAAAPLVAVEAPGRVCPRDYTYPPSVLARPADFSADTLYIVGGLYGNLAALTGIESMAALEAAPPQIVFNGDFHWFDAEPAWFAAIEAGVTPHRALRGNVETEAARGEDIGAGCGCAYPPSVSVDIVTRSNEILAQLAMVVPPAAQIRLAQLPMHLVADVGGLRIGIVHGDAQALAGWRFAQGHLDDIASGRWLAHVRDVTNIDVFACTHTCLSALRDFRFPAGRMTIANNGAAGMPNFSDTQYGIVTRIATTPSPHTPLYGLRRDGAHIDALAVHYDQEAFLNRFLARWPEGSPAHASYYSRIVRGPDFTLAHAAPP